MVTRDWDGYIFEYTKIPIDKTQCKGKYLHNTPLVKFI